MQDCPPFPCSVNEEDIAGKRVCPPPTEHRVQQKADDHCGCEKAVDEGDPAFGSEDGIPK
jgi:hypothetical protein